VSQQEVHNADSLDRLLATARDTGAEDVIVESVPRPSTIRVLRDAFEARRRRQLWLPKRLVFTSIDDDRTVASYHDAADQIVVNTSSRFWNDPAGSMRVEWASGFLVSDDPCAIVYHEIGHALHRRRYRLGLRWWSASSRKLRDDELFVARRVSRYAMDDAGEFVAEVFAGQLTGRLFDDEVLHLYATLRGPAL
jgi:hypothetical protein